MSGDGLGVDVIDPEVQLESDEPSPPHRRVMRWLLEWVIVLILALVAALVMRTYVFQTYFIPSGSMEPTLKIGDRIVVSKLSVEFGTIHTGDILVFTRPAAEQQDCGGSEVNDLVKRVIGLPKQELFSAGNAIYVKNPGANATWHRLAQSWTHNATLGIPIPATDGRVVGSNAQNPYIIPANNYFMMGDNESDSCDSRYWGTISRNMVVGKVILRVWPLSRIDFL